MNILTLKERRFWSRAVDHPPLTDAFDELTSSDIVLGLQRALQQELSASQESEIWSQVANLVLQLQQARVVLKRMVLMDKPVKCKPIRKIAPKPPTMIPASPICQPPSPIRSAKPQFCASRIEASLEAMKRHKDSVKIQEQGCRAVVELIKQGKKRRKENIPHWQCYSCKFHNEIEEEACRICSLRRANDEQTQVVLPIPDQVEWQVVESNGGISIIIDAMRRFPDHKRLIKSSSFALAQLVQENDKVVFQIASAGGIREILSGMQKLKGDMEVLTQSLGVLASPTLADDSVIRIEEETFVAVTCDILSREDITSTRLKAMGCLAMANLAVKSDEATRALMLRKVHKNIIKSLKKHQDVPNLVAAGLWALVALSRKQNDGSETSNCSRISQAGGVELAIDSFQRFQTNQSVSNNAKLLLENLGCSIDQEGGENCNIQ